MHFVTLLLLPTKYIQTISSNISVIARVTNLQRVTDYNLCSINSLNTNADIYDSDMPLLSSSHCVPTYIRNTSR